MDSTMLSVNLFVIQPCIHHIHTVINDDVRLSIEIDAFLFPILLFLFIVAFDSVDRSKGNLAVDLSPFTSPNVLQDRQSGLPAAG